MDCAYVGVECWVRGVDDVAGGGRRSGSNDTRLAHVLHYVSARSSHKTRAYLRYHIHVLLCDV